MWKPRIRGLPDLIRDALCCFYNLCCLGLTSLKQASPCGSVTVECFILCPRVAYDMLDFLLWQFECAKMAISFHRPPDPVTTF